MGQRRKKSRPPDPRGSAQEKKSAPIAESTPLGGWQFLWVWVVCVLLAIAVAVIYVQTLGHEMINCDDNPYVYENPDVAGGLTWNGIRWAATTHHAGNWHPLTWISHMLDVKWFGLHAAPDRWKGPEAGGHHLTNVVLHLASVIILFLALRQMTGALWSSALVAAMWAVHPLRVESVAWIAERKDVLSGLFWMLTLLAYGWYVRRPGVGRYLAVALCFALGLTAKSMLVTLPCVLLLLDYWPLGRMTAVKPRPLVASHPATTGRGFTTGIWQLLLEKLPLFALSAIVSSIVVVSQRSSGLMNMADNVPVGLRVSNAAIAYVTYLWKTIWPTNLAIFYPHPAMLKTGYTSSIIAGAVAAMLLLVVVTLVVLWQMRRRPYLAVGWFWYLGTLVPVIGLVQVGVQSMADRYTYLPMIGVYIAVVWGGVELAARWRWLAIPLTGAAVVLLAVWTAASFQQTARWKTRFTVFGHAIAAAEDNYFAHNHLGVAYFHAGEFDKAGEHYRKAVEAAPNYDAANANLGAYHMRRGEVETAIGYFQNAVRVNPYLGVHYINLGQAYLAQGRGDEAGREFRDAVEAEKDSAALHGYLGIDLRRRGKLHEAEVQRQEMFRLCANDAILLSELSRVFSLDRNDPTTLNDIAWLLATSPDASVRNGLTAVRLANRAFELAGKRNAAILGTLAAAYAEDGRFDEAVETAHRARSLALKQNNSALAESIEAKIAIYEAGKPYRESSFQRELHSP